MSATDTDLCARLAVALPGTFAEVVTRFEQRLFAFALRLTGQRSDAEDILQEALLGAYVALEGYPPTRIRTLHLQAWLYKITLHAYHHHHRGIHLHLVSLDTEDAVSSAQLADVTAEEPAFVLERWEQQQALLALLAQLPEQARIALTCYYLEDLSYQEIADLLDLPLGTVKSLLHRGLGRLRALLTVPQKGDVSWTAILRQQIP